MAYLVIDSQLFGICSNRLAILWFIDSRIFGALNEVNDLADSRFTGPDSVCGHFENDSISPLRTIRFRFENDSIFQLTDKHNEFILEFFGDFLSGKNRGGSNQAHRGIRLPKAP